MVKIVEIFDSVDGEVNGFGGIGQLSNFVRFGGCNLDCRYCDTQYARPIKSDSYVSMAIKDIVERCFLPKVTITGGEPFLQRDELFKLVDELVKLHKIITVETNGSFPVPKKKISYVGNLSYVVDYKLPSSGCQEFMSLDNFKNLDVGDWIKFVVSDEEDYNFAKDVIGEMEERWGNLFFSFAFSPIFKEFEPSLLLDYILEDYRNGEFGGEDLSLNVQLHKLINVR